MSKKIKPCPFCGEKDNFIILDAKCGGCDDFSVQCIGCGAQGSSTRSKNEAIDEWNKRDGSKEIALTFMRKDYLFSKDPHGKGILIEVDGVRVLLTKHLIMELFK